MSLNLCFNTVIGNHHIPFPFQTPTNLTNKVLGLGTRELQIQEIKAYLLSNYTSKEDKEYIDSIIEECTAMLNNPSIRLTYI